MTPLYLQDALVAELRSIFAGYTLRGANGTDKPLAVFPQGLPIAENNDDEDNQMPYIIVRLMSGRVPSAEDAQHVSVYLVLCVYDEAADNQGHQDLLHIIHKIYERFATEPVLAGQYIYTPPFSWVLSEEDTYPYFFGGVEMAFEVPALEKDDRLA